MGPIFLVHLWTFLVKIAYGLTFFLFLDRKRTKLSPKLISLRIFGNFCVQIKQKGVWVPSITAQSWFFVVPPWLGGGGFFVNVSIFSMSKFCVWCVFWFKHQFGSSDKFFSKLFCFWILCKPTSDSGIWFWLDKFKLKEGPENWSSGAFETDDFGWNLSKNAIFG